MFDIKTLGKGYVSVQTLANIMEETGRIIGDELRARDAEISALRDELKALRSEIETERRLRLGMKPR